MIYDLSMMKIKSACYYNLNMKFYITIILINELAVRCRSSFS